jgi:hypothetical protein
LLLGKSLTESAIRIEFEQAARRESQIVSVVVRGRGFGKFIEGDPITSPDQVNVGDLLTCYYTRFNARNLIRVTQTHWPQSPAKLKGTRFYGIIVDPEDPSRPGMGTTGDICFWFWEICSADSQRSGSVLHRAALPESE